LQVFEKNKNHAKHAFILFVVTLYGSPSEAKVIPPAPQIKQSVIA
jgi:hypothetical protein